MIGDGSRHAFRLRTGLPGATAAAVLAAAFDVLLPGAEVVVVTHDDEAPWPTGDEDAYAALRARADAVRAASRLPGAVRRALTAANGGTDVLLDPWRPDDVALALAALPHTRRLEVHRADEVDPVLVAATDERPELRLTEDELVRLRDLLVSRGIRPDALVQLAESEAEQRATWRGLASSAAVTVLSATSAQNAVEDLRDGYGGAVATGYDLLHLAVMVTGAVTGAWWFATGARRRWRTRRRR